MPKDVLSMSSDEEVIEDPSTSAKGLSGKVIVKKTCVKANSTVKARETGSKKRKSGSHDDEDDGAPLTKKDIPDIVKAVLEAISGSDSRRTSVTTDPEEIPEVEDLPNEELLRHVATLKDSGTSNDQATLPRNSSGGTSDTGSLLLGTSYPPVPCKLVKKITDGDFIEMSELLPDRLASSGDKELSKSYKKRRVVTDIIEWVRCFGLYIAIISRSAPERVLDLLGYQALIIDAYTEYKGFYWSGYDRQFRLRAAATPVTSWSTVDTTLWNRAFGGLSSAPRCTHCFSVSHKSSECELSPDPQVLATPVTSTSGRPSYQGRRPICFSWNEDPGQGCSRLNCKFEHSCYLCSKYGSVQDKNHKAIHCPHHPLDRPIRPQRPYTTR